MKNSIILVVILLSGCACVPPEPVIKIEIQRVEVPIAVPCKAVTPTKPDFNFDKLTVEQNVFDKTKALLADRKLHLGYEGELLTALNSCVK